MIGRGIITISLALASLSLAAQQVERPTRSTFRTIQEAARAGDLPAVAQFLEDGVGVNDQDPGTGETALLSALLRQRAEVADFLLDQGADPTVLNLNHTTPLQVAARYNLVALIPKLVEAGARPNQPGYLQRAPIHDAALRGHDAAIRALLELGADPNLHPRRGSHPLDLAIDGEKRDAVHALVDGGARIMQPFEEGTRRLKRAAEFGWDNVVAAGLAELSDPDRLGAALHRAIDGACLGGHVELLRRLVDEGGVIERRMVGGVRRLDLAAERNDVPMVQALTSVTPNADAASSPGGWTALHFAANNDAAPVASALLNHGLDPNAQDALGRSPLHLASRRGSARTVNILLRGGANITLTDLDGNSPLHLATMYRQPKAVEALLAAGADPTLANLDGVTARQIAQSMGPGPIPELFPEVGTSPPPLPANAQFLAQLLDRQNPERPQASFEEAIRAALQAEKTLLGVILSQPDNRVALMQAFLEEYPDAVNQRDGFGYRPIHEAAELAGPPMIAALLRSNARIDDQENPARWTPLHFAVSNANAPAVAYLLAQGADPTRVDALGRTPRDLAMLLGRAELFPEL